MAKRICCPNIFCNSTNVVPVSTKTKFSFGKAAVGGAVGSLFNPLGTAVGIATELTENGEKQHSYVKNAEKCLRKKFKFRW